MLLAFYLPTAIFGFCEGLLIPILPVFAAGFDTSLALIGVVLAGESFGMLLGGVPSGWLAGRLPPKTAMLLGGSVAALGVVLTPAAPSLAVVIGLRVLTGAGFALFNLSRHAYLTMSAREGRRGRLISIYGGVNRFGAFLGPAAGGLLAAWLGLGAPFFLYAMLAVVALVLALRYLPSIDMAGDAATVAPGAAAPGAAAIQPGTPGSGPAGVPGEAAPGAPPPAKVRRDRQHVRELLRSSRTSLINAGIGQLLGQTVRAGRVAIIPLYASQVLGLDIATVGLIVSVSGFVDMSLFYPAGWIMDRFGRKYSIIPCFLIQAIGLALIPLTGGAGALMAVGVLIGIGNGLGSGNMMTLGSDLAPRGAVGEFLGLWRLIGDAGFAVGPILVGAVAQVVGLGASAFTIAAIGVLSVSWFALRVPETLKRSRYG